MAFFVIKSVAPVAMSKTLGHRVSIVPASELSCKTADDVQDLVYVRDLVRKGWEHEVTEVSQEEWEAAKSPASNGYTKTGKLADFYQRQWNVNDQWS